MIVDSKYRPELIANAVSCSCREHLQHVNIVEEHAGVYISPNWRENPYMAKDSRPGFGVVTNGRVLLVFPCILEKGDVVGAVRADAFKLARQFRKKATGNLTIKLGHRKIAIGRDKVIMSRLLPSCDKTLKFPDTTQIVPSGDCKPTEVFAQMAFTTQLLNQLTGAMGSPDGIVFNFTGVQAPVIVRPESDNSVLGVVMPRVLQ